MPYFDYDLIRFHYRDAGAGTPFVFQHGLGGSVEQPFSLFTPPSGFRLLAFDCRGHGKSEPLGPAERIGLASFADDLGAFLDFLAVPQVVVGGISMGAAVALNFALRFPNRIKGLVLSRPAWLAAPNPRNAAWFGEIARLIREHGPQHGQAIFRQSDTYAQVQAESPDVAQSMLNQFANPRADATVITLDRLRGDAPCRNLEELASIRVPTLVMANQQDPVHPFAYGQTLAASIPGAEFVELTAKSQSPASHQADVQRHLSGFLVRSFHRAGSRNSENNGPLRASQL